MPRTLSELFALPSSEQNPVLITKAERELIYDIELQPVKKPLQVVGRGAIEFLGYHADFEKDIYRVSGNEIDTQKAFQFWYRMDYSSPEENPQD